jgi:hypothetical protein
VMTAGARYGRYLDIKINLRTGTAVDDRSGQ